MNLKKKLIILDVVTLLHPIIDEKFDILKKELNDASKSAKVFDSRLYSDLEEKIKSLSNEKDFLLQEHIKEKTFYIQKIEALEHENKIMTEKLIKNAKKLISDTSTLRSKSIDNKSGLENNNKRENSLNTSNVGGINDSISKYRNNNSSLIGPNGNKILSNKNLLTTINFIYTSKVEYDKKCFDYKIPKETMEQHMYTYLNTKFGIKNLVLENASNIINAVKAYSTEDSEICLFGKV